MTYSDNDKRSNSSSEPVIAASCQRRETISLCDIKSLDFLAEDILHEMRFNGYSYSENGEHLFPSSDELAKLVTEYHNDIANNILEFRYCTVFRNLSMHEFCQLTVEEIQEVYLSEILPKACAMMRKQAPIYINAELSPEITDDYLKDLVTIRWRDNAMLWIVQVGKPWPRIPEIEDEEE